MLGPEAAKGYEGILLKLIDLLFLLKIKPKNEKKNLYCNNNVLNVRGIPRRSKEVLT